MSSASVQPVGGPESGEFTRLYYTHQYERVSELENHRLNLTNYVAAITTAILAFGFPEKTDPTLAHAVGLALVIATVNAFAIAYVCRAREYIAVHKRRAREVLRSHAPDLAQLNESVRWEERQGWLRTPASIQIWLHVILLLTAAIPVYMYCTWERPKQAPDAPVIAPANGQPVREP